MVTHPRILDNTVRKTDDRRKRKRAEKADRRAAEESAQEQEVKRLKNVKGTEIQQRSGQILCLHLVIHGTLIAVTVGMQLLIDAMHSNQARQAPHIAIAQLLDKGIAV